MLLHPFEEQLDTPTVFVEQSDVLWCNIKIIGIEDKSAVAILVIIDYATQDGGVLAARFLFP